MLVFVATFPVAVSFQRPSNVILVFLIYAVLLELVHTLLLSAAMEEGSSMGSWCCQVTFWGQGLTLLHLDLLVPLGGL